MSDKTSTNSQRGAMFGVSIRDWLTYTNVAYLLSLLLTFALTATLWRVSVAAQNESDKELEKYKADAAVKIAKVQGEAASARLETAKIRREAAGRTLSQAEAGAFLQVLVSSKIKVSVACLANDPESIAYAVEINFLLEQAKIDNGKVTPNLGNFFFGTHLEGPAGPEKEILKRAFLAAGAHFVDVPADTFRIFIGAKVPILLLSEDVPH